MARDELEPSLVTGSSAEGTSEKVPYQSGRGVAGEGVTGLSVRAQILLWGAQRATAAILALCVLVHLATIVYAVRNGLTAAEILQRTRGSFGWAAFYGVFVAAVAVHAPIGLRNVLAETLRWRGRGLDTAMLALAALLALWGWRAVYAVVAT